MLSSYTRGCLTLLLLFLMYNGVSTTTQINSMAVQAPLRKVMVPKLYDIKLNPEMEEGSSVFHGEVKIVVHAYYPCSSVTMNSKNLVMDEEHTSLSSMEGVKTHKAKKHSYVQETGLLTIEFDRPVATGKYILGLKYTGNFSSTDKGIYKFSYDKENGEKSWYVASQLRPNYASMVFPCWYEPELKASFSLSIKHHPNYTAVSNMPVLTEHMDNDGKRWTHFKMTSDIPTYLLTFVVSDFHCLYERNDKIRVCGRKDVLPYLKYSKDLSERAIRFLEEYMHNDISMGYYNATKLDIFSIPLRDPGVRFVSTWGIISYRENNLIYDPSVDSGEEIEYRTNILVGALAEQWLGNVLTIESWKDYWLVTGLSTYLDFYVVDKLYPEWDEWDQYDMYELGFYYGDEDMYRPLSGNIKNEYPKASMITVLADGWVTSFSRMLSNIITEETFNEGIAEFVNSRTSLTSDNLWAALSTVYNKKSGPPLEIKQIMRPWLKQHGYPIISVIRDHQTGKVTITQRSNIKSENSTRWWVPINFATKSNPDFERTTPTHWLKPHEDSLIIDGVAKDDWIIVNIQQTGLYRVEYDKSNWKLIVEYMKSENYKKIHVRNRVQLIDDLTKSHVWNPENVSLILDLSTYLVREHDYRPWRRFMRSVVALKSIAFDDEIIQEINKFYLPMFENMTKMFGYADRSNYNLVTKYRSYYDMLDNKTEKSVPNDKAIGKINKSKDFVMNRNRGIFLGFACRLGDKFCKNLAKTRLRANLKNETENPISPDMREWTRCSGAEGNEDELIKLASNSSTEYYLKYTSCSPNKTAIKNYIEKAMTGRINMTVDLFQSAISYLVHDKSGTLSGMTEAIDYFVENFRRIYKYFEQNKLIESVIKDIMTRLLQDCIRHTAQLQKISKLVDNESTLMDPQIKDYIKSEITNRHGGVTSAILKKWLRDNASIVSATVK